MRQLPCLPACEMSKQHLEKPFEGLSVAPLCTISNAKIHSHREDRDTYLLGHFQLLALDTYPGIAMGSGFSIEDDSTNGTATIDVEMFKKLKSDYEAKKEGIEPKITLSLNSFAPNTHFSSVC